MTITDDADARDLQKHAARDMLIEQYRKTFGLTRRRANEEFMAHIESDEEERVERQIMARVKRPRRRALQEAQS